MLKSRQPLLLALTVLLSLSVSSPQAADAPATGSSGTGTPPSPRLVTTVEGISEYRYNNGLRLLLFPDSSTSKVTVNMTVLVGSRHEGYGETGMAHLLEHMLFKGTPRHRNVPRLLRDLGAEFNGTTWYDRTNYYESFKASARSLETALRLEADRLLNSYVKREDLVSEMTVVRSEFEAGENDPQGILRQRMLANAYEWHNYGKSTIGNRADIERVPIEKLRAFYHKYYQPDNVVLILAGNFEPAKALALVTEYFGPLKKPARQLENTYTEEPAQDGERTVVLRRVGSVGVAGAVYHVPAGPHPDSAALEVLAGLLDNEPSGVLYKALVKKKLASKVNASNFTLHDPGMMVILAQADRDHTPEEVRDVLLEKIEELHKEKIAAAEVDRIKRKLANEWKTLLDDSNKVGQQLSEWAAMGDWRLFFLFRDRVAKVTPADVQRVARLYLQRSNRTVGLYLPSKVAQRAHIPATPNVEELVRDYKGGKAVAMVETFDPTPENIEKRVQRPVLDCGVKTALLPRKTRGNKVQIRLTLHYGNPDSLRGNTSATQLLASLMARGTKKHSRQELTDELDRLQAKIVPSGLLGDAQLYVECKRENLPAVLGLLHEVLREPTFPAEDFNVIKRQLRTSLIRQKTDPQMLAVRALQRKLSPFPKDHIRYVPTVEESIERLDAVTLEQVRKLYEEQMGGQAGEVVVVGDFDPASTLPQLETLFKGWKAKVPYRRIERPAVKGVKGTEVIIETPDKANAIYLAGLTLPLKDDNADNAALEVGSYLFGGGPLSNRLADRLRQKEGLCYGVGAHFTADAQDPSARLMLFAICNPKNIDKVARGMREEMERLRKEGVTAAEVSAGQKAFLEQLKTSRTEDAQLVALLQEGLQAGRTMSYYADLEKKVSRLTAEEVAAAFRRHFDPRNLVIIRAGDFKKK